LGRTGDGLKYRGGMARLLPDKDAKADSPSRIWGVDIRTTDGRKKWYGKKPETRLRGREELGVSG